MDGSPRIAVTFRTTADAMACERLCRAQGLPGRLFPAPRAFSADCGIAWSAPADARERIAAALTEAGVDYAGVFAL